MSENILALIIGGGIAIVSGGLSHFLNNHFKSRSDKQKYVFEKLEDIIMNVSELEQGLHFNMAGILKIPTAANKEKSQNLVFQQAKLRCLVEIYHNDLSESFRIFDNAMVAYQKRKRDILNLERTEPSEKRRIFEEYERLRDDFDELCIKLNEFRVSLSKYGNKKMK